MLDRREALRNAALAIGLAAVSSPLAAAKPSPQFPKGFLWGSATAGHQVEGNNINSDSWLLENVKPSLFTEPSRDAVNSFALWPRDLELVKNLGLNTYRFSIEWARIEPEQGQFSLAMLDHYKQMIDACAAQGLTPFVTFNHFTTPRWFAARGGWEAADSPDFFVRYCERAAKHLAGQMGYATTLNEPNLAGLLQGLLPPGVLAGAKTMGEAAAKVSGTGRFSPGNALFLEDPAAVQKTLISAHKRGREAIKGVRPDLPVGVSLAIIDDQAVGKNSLRDAMRAKFYGAWLEASKGDDFLGVQNYERSVWTDKGKLPPPAGARLNTMGAEVYPPSLAGACRYAHAATGNPIIVTEHGIGTDDDTTRAWLIPEALGELKKAIDDGVPIKGYLHWSLLDNFEWIFGYKIKFGLHTVDPATFERKAKPSAAVFAAIARRNAL